MSDLPTPGLIPNFLAGLDILRPYVGGTTVLESHGNYIAVRNVLWSSLTEAHQGELSKLGWAPHYDTLVPMWGAEG